MSGRSKERALRGPLEREARAVLADAARAMSQLERHSGAGVAAAAECMIACLEAGGTVFWCGNGGSAADAQHMAAELAGRYLLDRPSLPAVALTTNSSALTAIGNDYGFEFVFSRQLESLGSRGDVLVAITTSGASANVTQAVRAARRIGMTVVGLTGLKGGSFAALCDVALITPHDATPRIQEGHVAMAHAMCELVERSLFGHANARSGVGGRRAKSPARVNGGPSRPRAAQPRAAKARRR